MFQRERAFDRLFVFDHGLGNLPGHWVNYHRAIVEESRRRGLDPHIFGYKQIDTGLVGDLPATPLFEHGPGAAPGSDLRSNHRLRNQAFLADLGKLDLRDYGPRDIFLFPSVQNYELEAVLAFSARFEAGRKPAFLVLFQFDNGLAAPELPDLPPLVRFDRWLKARVAPRVPVCGSDVADLYRQCPRAVPRRSSQRRLVFMAPSGGLDDAFARLLRREVRSFCMPVSIPGYLQPWAKDGTADIGDRGSGLTVGFLGHSCARKGLPLLPGIVRAIRSRRDDVRFEIQVNNYLPAQPHAASFTRLFSSDVPGVVYHRGHFDRDQYFSLLSRTDIVLLPYDPAVYRYMPSGLLHEALGAGKVVVVPEGTSLARQAASVDAGALAFSEFTEESIVDALSRAITSHAFLREKARAAAPRWLRQHNLQAFMDQLLEQARRAA